ncbi:helicase associated domain-containing protein [Bacillus thuringiensis]|uniref:helicase associated domain-containing protein n=1 Tax=Bacillus thuringiensis TaxID=1428 RepID=UPI00355B0742
MKGHHSVPYRYKKEKYLRNWIRAQRKDFFEGKMSEKRIDKFNQIAFFGTM